MYGPQRLVGGASVWNEFIEEERREIRAVFDPPTQNFSGVG